jgi:cytochrome c-type biogenesis protein CcmH/NrfG
MPSLADMKHMADKQAEPLLTKLKDHPLDAQLLAQIGGIYMRTHQFKEAGDYYSRSLKIDPKNVVTRDALASSLYYAGDSDGAIEQLEGALKQNANDPNTLFNLGVIKWKAKNDSTGALTAWHQLLKSNPGLEATKRGQVEKLIADVRAGTKH